MNLDINGFNEDFSTLLSLKGKRALICGASSGIGRATAILFANAGAEVVAVARTEEKLVDLAHELSRISIQKEQPHLAIRNHLTVHQSYLVADAANREHFLSRVKAEHQKKPFDILFLNSGGPKGGPISQAEPESFLAAMDQHLVLNSQLAAMMIPEMKEKKWGRIITITSTSVKIPIAHLGVSNTVRAAVASWAKTLSLELAPFGITVNNILPGYTDTDRLDQLLESGSLNQKKPKADLAAEWIKTIPAGRFGTPEEIAQVALFFASKLSSFVTGTNLQVDGGRTGSL